MLSWNHLFLFIRVFSAVVAVSLLSVSCGNSPKAPRELDLTALDACGQYNEILELTAKLHPWQGPASYLDYVQRVAQAIPSFVSNRIDELSIQDFEDYQKAIPSESDVQEWSEYLSGCRMIVDLNAVFEAKEVSLIDQREVFWFGLEAAGSLLDEHTRFSRPSSSNFYSFGLRLNDDAVFNYNSKFEDVVVLGSRIESVAEGSKIIQISFPYGITDPFFADLNGQTFDTKNLDRKTSYKIFQAFRFGAERIPSIQIQFQEPDTQTDELKTVVLIEPVDEPHFIFRQTEHAVYARLFQFSNNVGRDFGVGLRNAIERYEEQYKQKPSLILDLSFNPGGSSDEAEHIQSLFVSNAQLNTHQMLASREVRYSEPNAPFEDYPLIIIVNHLSASASEMTAQTLGNLKNTNGSRAFVIGEDTYGKGIFQSVISRSSMASIGGQFFITSGYFYGPEGRNVQKTGYRVHHHVTASAAINSDKNDCLLEFDPPPSQRKGLNCSRPFMKYSRTLNAPAQRLSDYRLFNYDIKIHTTNFSPTELEEAEQVLSSNPAEPRFEFANKLAEIITNRQRAPSDDAPATSHDSWTGSLYSGH